MKYLLISKVGSFHFSYEGRDLLCKRLFPLKCPFLVPFKYGGIYKDKEMFLKDFDPKEDGLIIKPDPEGRITHCLYCPESLRQMIKDQNTQEDSREIFKAVLEADYGQKFYDYVKEDKTDRGTYEVLLEAMKKYDFLPEDEI